MTTTDDAPVTETMVNGQPYQPATVLGATLFRELRNHGYRVGMTSWDALAVAAYTTEKVPTYPVNAALNHYYRLKSEWWYALTDQDSRASFWAHFYGQQPSRPVRW